MYAHTGIQKSTYLYHGLLSRKPLAVLSVGEAQLLATLIRGIVRGNFTANGQNHGKPTYKKDDLEFGGWDLIRGGCPFPGGWIITRSFVLFINMECLVKLLSRQPGC